MNDPTIRLRAIEYATLSGITLDLKTPLGHGTDGSVWRSSRKTAVKSLERKRNYAIELECYQRFRNEKVTKILGFSVPKLRNHNDDFLIIEMGIVRAPFILDFAKAHLDRPHEFTAEQREEWEAEGQERFEGR